MTGDEFEQHVRQVARSIWNLGPSEGGAEFMDGQEIDCVCRTPDVVHLVECTMERTLDKVNKDINKLVNARRGEERKGNTAKGWIVTLSEPTPHQRTQSRANAVSILSISEFRAKLFDAADYLNARWKYRFGSATDPDTGKLLLPDNEFVPLPFTNVDTGEEYTIAKLIELLTLAKRTVVLLGPFGAGKSLTVREVFHALRQAFFEDSSSPVPVAVNLREHWGQADTDEALQRHASRIGFQHRYQLVRAWNAGILVPLLGNNLLASTTKSGDDGADGNLHWRCAPEPPHRCRLRLMTHVFLDDSGKFSDSDFVCLAGYIADDDGWNSLCADWGTLLSKHKIPFIHMKDMVALRGPYENLGWTHEQRDAVLSEFIDTIRKHVIAGFGVGVAAKYLRSMEKEARRVIGDPYLLCFQRILRRVIGKLREIGYTGPITAVFDDCEEYSVRCYRMWSALRTHAPELALLMPSITFADDVMFYPLQAADILAWETNKHLRQMAGQHKIRKQMERLMQSTEPGYGLEYISEFYDAEALDRLYSDIKSGKVQVLAKVER